jgi:hypothetical protein
MKNGPFFTKFNFYYFFEKPLKMDLKTLEKPVARIFAKNVKNS